MSSDAGRMIRVLALGLLAYAGMPALAGAQVVKWTDANGQVHYSDHAPADQGAVAVPIVKTPKAPPARRASTRAATVDNSPVKDGDYTPEMKALMERQRQDALERDADRKRYEQSLKEPNKKWEQDVVASCKARRETYCNKGAQYIMREEHFRALEQKQAELSSQMHGGR